MARALLGALVRGRAQVLLALDLHGGVEEDAEQVGQSVQTAAPKVAPKVAQTE